jgi:hypothetical protein
MLFAGRDHSRPAINKRAVTMPDFTMCDGICRDDKECPQRDQCERFLNMPDEGQQWFLSAPYNLHRKSCGFFKSFQEVRKD